MITIAFSAAFHRSFKRIYRNQPARQAIFQQKVTLFISDPFHPQLRTHKLSGKLKDFYAFSIEYDIRIICYFVSGTEVIFEDIGTHDEVY